MDDTFCNKQIWEKSDWAVFLAKLDTLRLQAGLKKREFSNAIGVWNIYRKDMHRPDPDTIDRICHAFNVTKEWLCSPTSANGPVPPAAVASLSDRLAHTDIIQRFQNKGLAREINARLLELETIDPEKLSYVKGVLDGLLEALRSKKKSVNGG